MVDNPQFPHRCIITRLEQSDPNDAYSPMIENIILESLCQNQVNEVGDTIYKEGQLFSDYTTYLPIYQDKEELIETMPRGLVLKKGDTITIQDNIRELKLEIAQFEKGNIGIRIWSNGNKGE